MPRQNRGDIWLVDLGRVAKVRPCLVISTPARLQDRALVTVVTHTTSTRGSRFEVPIKLIPATIETLLWGFPVWSVEI